MEKKTILAFVLSLAVLIRLVYPLRTKAGAENRTIDKRRDRPVSTRSDRLASTGAGRPENGKACGSDGCQRLKQKR